MRKDYSVEETRKKWMQMYLKSPLKNVLNTSKNRFYFRFQKKNDAHRQKKDARQVKNIAEIQFYEEKDRKRCLQSVFLIRPATRTRKHLNIYAHNRSDTTI